MVIFDEDKQKKQLSDLRKQEEEDLVRIYAEKLGIPYINLSGMPIEIEALQTVREATAKEAEVVPFNLVGKKLKIGIKNPENPKTKAVVESLTKQGIEPIPFLVSTQSLQKAWPRYEDVSVSIATKAGALEISNEKIARLITETKTLGDLKKIVDDTLKLERRSRVSRIIEVILAGALGLKASDVHTEPEEESVRLRYRLDGVLTDIARIDYETYNLLLSRIKLVSGLKLNLNKIAQDGRFTIEAGENEIEIRTSVLPGAYSEAVVLRVLNPDAINVPLEALGINPRLFKVIEHEIGKPTGMILTTGPTGSGKTTTLYAFLKKIYSPGTKILTIENPIEYHLEGIVQTQTDRKSGYTFLEGLRAALRQDPDVIMVGEIRDSETAEIAVNAALTGHLVFSTLHTNNAAGTFPRLIDLGVNPKVITSAMNLSLAQRLVRKIDPEFKKEIKIEGKDRETIDRILASISDKTYLEGLQTEMMWTSEVPEGIEATGYKGRIGLYEGILADEKIEEVVQLNPSEREINAAAAHQNILNMQQDAVIKVLQGVTTLDEVRRVIDLGE